MTDSTRDSVAVKGFHHKQSNTLTYVVYDETTKKGVVIDAAMDFDPVSGCLSSESISEVVEYCRTAGVGIEWVMETHAHADHVTAAPFVAKKLGAKTAHSEGITGVQARFKAFFNLDESFQTDGSQFDRLLVDGDEIAVGNMTVRVLATPGHTPDSVSYVAGKNAFVGDTVFMPDMGTARCDFPGGDPALLYDSIKKIYDLGPDTTVWVCHDYQPQGRELAYKTTVAEQLASNIQLTADTTKPDYVTRRKARDATLLLPKLIYPSIQLNIRAGSLPVKEASGTSYLKMPIFLKEE